MLFVCFLPWWLSLPPASWMLLQHFSSCILWKPLRLACMCVHHSLRIMLFTWTYVILYFMVGGVQCILLTMQQNIFKLMHPWWCKLMLHRVVVFCGGIFLVMCAYVHMCEYRVKSWHLHRTAKCLCSPANVLFWLSVSVILLFVCLGGLRGWGDEKFILLLFYVCFVLLFFLLFFKGGREKTLCYEHIKLIMLREQFHLKAFFYFFLFWGWETEITLSLFLFSWLIFFTSYSPFFFFLPSSHLV